MSKKINIVIVGAGNIAREHLRALAKIKNINVLCICSRTLTKAINLSQKFKVNNYSSNAKLFIKENKNIIDGIMILVSLNQIYKVSKELSVFSIPLFIEKPPTLSLSELNNLNLILDKHKVPNMVGMNRRFYSIFEKGKKIIDKNGGLYSIVIEGHERLNLINKIYPKKILNKWLYANSCHTIDLIRYFGGEIKKFYYTKNSKIINSGDHFSCSFKYNTGATGTYISNWLSPGGWSIRLYSKNIKVIFEPLEKGYVISKDNKKKLIKPNLSDVNLKPGFYMQLRSFIKLIKLKKNIYPSQSIKDITMTYRIIDKISG